MAVLSKIKSHSDAVNYFKELPFYNKHIKKPKVKRLKNIDQLGELPFYEQLGLIKTNQVFTDYAKSYKVEMVERKDPIVQLEAIKLGIKDLLSNLLNEIKGFKYQITVKVSLKNTSSIEKLNQKILFKIFYTWFILGLMSDLATLLNKLSLIALTFQFIDLYQEVPT